MSDAVPNFQSVANDICVVKSMFTEQFNQRTRKNCCSIPVRRARAGLRWDRGSLMVLGTENENLPGFVVLISSGVQPSAGQSAWGSGFLPSVFQGVQCPIQGRSRALRW